MAATPLDPELLDQLIDIGNQALGDYYHDRACACSAWPASCLTPSITRGMWDTDTFAVGLPAIISAYEAQRAAGANQS